MAHHKAVAFCSQPASTLAPEDLVANLMAGVASMGVQKEALRNLVTALDVDLRGRGVRAASVTVNGTIAPGTAVDPDLIAAEFARLVDDFDAGAGDWKTTVAIDGGG